MTEPMTPPADELGATLAAWRSGRLDARALAGRWRAAAATWPGLPPRYAAVLDQLLLPLEASAMFSEESCSFSPTDLAETLAQWLAHADAAAPRR